MLTAYDVERLIAKFEQIPISQISMKDISSLLGTVVELAKEVEALGHEKAEFISCFDDRHIAKIPIGENVKRRRQKRNFKAAALAHQAKITPAYLSQVELGKRTPTLSTLKKIAGAFNIPTWQLLRVGNDQD